MPNVVGDITHQLCIYFGGSMKVRFPPLLESRQPRPTVILSADAGADVRSAVHEAGLPLLMKPLKPLALKSVLDRLLAARTVT